MVNKKCLFGPTLRRKIKYYLTMGVGALPKVLKVYIGKATLLIDPIRSMLGNYVSGCYSVALATR